MAESTFTVSGSRHVAGVAPGGTVTAAALGSADVAALIAAGHLTASKPAKQTTTTSTTTEE